MPRPGGVPGLARRITSALLVLLATTTDACPFAPRRSGGGGGRGAALTQPSLSPAALTARARALLATDLGLGGAGERVFSPQEATAILGEAAPNHASRRALKAATAGADAATPLLPAADLGAASRPTALHIKLEEADGMLPDAALLAKILSKNATTVKEVLARVTDLEWHTLAAEAVVASAKDVPVRVADAKAALAQFSPANKTVATEAVARAVIEKLATPNQWGLLLRAAFHDAGAGPDGLASTSYPAGSLPVGGADGSLRHELHWDSNAGVVGVWPTLVLAKKVLDAKFGNGTFSWADVIAIGGAAGVKAAGGPAMSVGYGRVDALAADPRTGPATDPSHAKDFTAPALLAAFAGFGVPPDATVTLMGAHTMGLAMLTGGSEGPLGPPKFTNFFYAAILAGKGSFAVDNALASYPGTAPLVKSYAADQAAFFEAFETDYRAMTWWGQPGGAWVG